MTTADTLPAERGLTIPHADPGWVVRQRPPFGSDYQGIHATTAPRPPLDHRCWGQSVDTTGHGNTWRCPCGAARFSGPDGPGAWELRNRRVAPPDPAFQYPEAARRWPRPWRTRIARWLR